MPDHCTICERIKALPSEFCEVHDHASRNLEGAYSAWKKAFDEEFTKEEYYAKIAVRPETGQSVKEVIRHLLGAKVAE
jgi:hypothetical protein